MYTISKRMEIAGCHKLSLGYESKCKNIHGHNWIITVHCRSKTLNSEGMLVDFKHIKNNIHEKLDHQFLNEVLPEMNPTAENISKWVCDNVEECFRVDVQESEGNIATYEVDEE